MDFTVNNGLSMTGGDDISDIQTEIDVLDASVVHKTGNLNESIDGNKTFTGETTLDTAGVNTIQSSLVGIANLMNASAGVNKFTANATDGANYLQATGDDGKNILFAKTNTLYGVEGNLIESNLPNSVLSNVVGNEIKCVGGYNLITSAALSTNANVIQSTGNGDNVMVTSGGGDNAMSAQGTGKNYLISQNSNNEIIAGASSANLMLVGTVEKLNMTSSTTTLTNGTTNINGALTVTNSGAPSIRLNGNNTDGNYIAFHPEGTTRRAYLGFPGLGAVNFVTENQYTNGTIANIINGVNKSSITTTTTTLTNNINVIDATANGGNRMEVASGNGGNVLRAIGAGTGGGGFNSIIGRNNYYDATPGGHLIRTGASGSEVNKITVYPTSTTLTNNSHTITATGNNILNTSAGENFMNVTAGNGSNVLQVTSTVAGAGNKLLAGSSANGFNQISGYNNYYDVNSFGAHYIRVNGGDRIYVNGTNVNITNTNIDLIGDVYNYSPGGPSFNSIGTGSGGLYHTYYPDGFGAGRKAYVGYPGGGSTEFAIRNDYNNGSIALGVAGTGTMDLNVTVMRKNNIVYPNIQIQWQTFGVPSGLNQYKEMTNSYYSNGNFTVGEGEYIKFPFDVRCNWIMISFEAASFNGFTSRNLEIAFQSAGGAFYTVGSTGPILGNADRAQYIQCNTTVLPFNTELRPLYIYYGTPIGGSFYAKQFTANFNFTQQ